MKTKEEILSDIKTRFKGELCYTAIKVAMEEYGKQCYNQAIEDASHSASTLYGSFKGVHGNVCLHRVNKGSILKLKKT